MFFCKIEGHVQKIELSGRVIKYGLKNHLGYICRRPSNSFSVELKGNVYLGVALAPLVEQEEGMKPTSYQTI